ncbi:MAG: KUP/HAK/KT family potassium transporter, partial [Anaerolineae bacterium]|nr:KUP/HAK/KT family potassium transporter [Anaerolineae bacterium]
SSTHIGQVYVPFFNGFLFVGSVLLYHACINPQNGPADLTGIINASCPDLGKDLLTTAQLNCIKEL